MKKILVAILAGAFGLSAVAQTVVYDYKATFKRVNPVYKVRTENKVKFVTESYNVSSDRISGYVILPLCVDCNGPVNTSMNNAGVAFLTRKGDKYSKANNLPYVLRTNVMASSAIFGNNAYILGTTPADETPSSVKNLKSAWMMLGFAVPNNGANTIDSGKLIKEAAGFNVWYGFMGLDHIGGGWVQNYGFGSARVLTNKQAATLGWCGGLPGATTSCPMGQSISGSTLADFVYAGLCGATPMWDVCSTDTLAGWSAGMANVGGVAPIAGTWTLKFNNTLSKKGGPAAQQTAIYDKLKVTNAAAQVIDVAGSPIVVTPTVQ